LLDCTIKVTAGEQEDCNKFVFQNGMLQKRKLDGDDDMMVMVMVNIQMEGRNLET